MKNKSLKKWKWYRDSGCLLLLFLFILFWGNVSFHQLTHYWIDKNGKTVIGYITSEKYIIGNSKIIKQNSFTSGYEFTVNNKEYTGNSHRNDLSFGSPVEIEYVSFCPFMNRLKREQ
jgi:hypothetical protein